MYKNWLTK